MAKFLVYTGLAQRLSFFFKMASRSLTEVVNELTENKDLRAVFAYIFGTYGRLNPACRPAWMTPPSVCECYAIMGECSVILGELKAIMAEC